MHRLCIQFEDFETRKQIEDRRVLASHLSKHVLLKLNIERILFHEVLKIRPEIRQPARITNGIEKKVDLERLKRLKGRVPDAKKIKQLVEQFESIYCYSMLKSIVMSEIEQENPKFACLAIGYKVEKNSINKTPFYGLKSFEKNKGPINHLLNKKDCVEYLNSYSLLGRRCFQEVFEYITTQTLTILNSTPIFQASISEESAYMLMINADNKKKY